MISKVDNRVLIEVLPLLVSSPPRFRIVSREISFLVLAKSRVLRYRDRQRKCNGGERWMEGLWWVREKRIEKSHATMANGIYTTNDTGDGERFCTREKYAVRVLRTTVFGKKRQQATAARAGAVRGQIRTQYGFLVYMLLWSSNKSYGWSVSKSLFRRFLNNGL